MLRIKRQDVDCGRAEHHQIPVVRIHPLVILLASPLARHPVHGLIVLLVWLARPGEEEPARAAVL